VWLLARPRLSGHGSSCCRPGCDRPGSGSATSGRPGSHIWGERIACMHQKDPLSRLTGRGLKDVCLHNRTR
jgi:hypothetical protein